MASTRPPPRSSAATPEPRQPNAPTPSVNPQERCPAHSDGVIGGGGGHGRQGVLSRPPAARSAPTSPVCLTPQPVGVRSHSAPRQAFGKVILQVGDGDPVLP